MLQIIPPELERIAKMPTSRDGAHESCFRSHAIMMYVRKMAERGDSTETIKDVMHFLMSAPTVDHKIDAFSVNDPLNV